MKVNRSKNKTKPKNPVQEKLDPHVKVMVKPMMTAAAEVMMMKRRSGQVK